mmetsp:Transcript_7745/g.17949  ORF Transcript_7745/g.17949 Transcript_7745/m.17949 type:complete len:285 (+) Transcript_7745:1370-2224(+)
MPQPQKSSAFIRLSICASLTVTQASGSSSPPDIDAARRSRAVSSLAGMTPKGAHALSSRTRRRSCAESNLNLPRSSRATGTGGSGGGVSNPSWSSENVGPSSMSLYVMRSSCSVAVLRARTTPATASISDRKRSATRSSILCNVAVSRSRNCTTASRNLSPSFDSLWSKALFSTSRASLRPWGRSSSRGALSPNRSLAPATAVRTHITSFLSLSLSPGVSSSGTTSATTGAAALPPFLSSFFAGAFLSFLPSSSGGLPCNSAMAAGTMSKSSGDSVGRGAPALA